MYNVDHAQRTQMRGLHLVSGRTEQDVAAALVVHDGLGICWYNRRLVYGHVLDLVVLWARMTAEEGWQFAALRSIDLAGLD